MRFNIVEKGIQTLKNGKWIFINNNSFIKDANDKYFEVELTVSESELANIFGVSSSKNPDFVYKKLNNFFRILDEKDYSNNRDLSSYVMDVYNFSNKIYAIGNQNYQWQYKSITNSNSKCYSVELRYKNNRVMSVVVETTLKGNLLSFIAMYHTDKNSNSPILGGYEFVDISKLYTTVIKINCPLGKKITFSDEVYDLDLLNGKEFSNELLLNNLVSEHYLVLVHSNRKR